MTITIHHRIPRDDIALGLVRVQGVVVGPASTDLSEELELWIEHRNGGTLMPEEEELRKASRDMLRNGSYKPTGRGKPASEYLMRAAGEGNFPRINGPVDANNLLSLKYCLPISVWDLELAQADGFEFRLGQAGESYVFNTAGQELDLTDLVCGGADSRPMVTPIKDSLATKLHAESVHIAGCVYYPLSAGTRESLERATDEFLRWLRTCGPDVQGSAAICMPQRSVTF